MSFLTHLECSECEESFGADRVQTYCSSCQAPLLSRYDLGAAKRYIGREEIQRRPSGNWRWRELLPVDESSNMIHLGEGDTPLLKTSRLGSQLGLSNLYVKDESSNPTGTFKARGLVTAVSKAKELGVEKIIIPTAGNAGGALAAYAARGGLKARIIMPEDTPTANKEECRIAGAEVILVDGLISDAAKMAREMARSEGWFDVSTFKEPYRVEGKKIMGYELAEAFGWVLPEVIIYPTGGGTGLVGMWKAFREMEALEWIDKDFKPRMVAVQSDGCAPVVHAFESGKSSCEFWANASTYATGLRVPKSFADKLILASLRESKGTAVAVSEDMIRSAQKLLASTEGVFAAPEGAATLAGLQKLIDQNWIKSDEKVVLFNTGTGLKYVTP